MKAQELVNYNRIAEAIEYLAGNFREQPALDDVARKVHLSPFHFQRLFNEWAGTSPKKFLQYISLEHAKKLLKEHGATLPDAAAETGLSGTGRLHDLFVNIEGMTPAEYRDGGKDLSIRYSFAESPFGNIIVAATGKGICHMAFYEDEDKAFDDLLDRFPKATLITGTDQYQQDAITIFQSNWSDLREVKLHLRGTRFQLKVWETLLKIPMGNVATYGGIARQIGQPNASRAVGTAIGHNPVAYLIPCHRVIQSTGATGGYMWGSTRKTAILGWEAAKVFA